LNLIDKMINPARAGNNLRYATPSDIKSIMETSLNELHIP
jgi:hypothetical protein